MLVVYLTSPLVVGSLFFCFIPDSRPSLFPKREDCVRFSSEWCFPRHSSHQQQQIGSMMAAPITRWMLLCLALLSLTPASFSSLMTFHQGGYNQLQIALAAQTPVPANCSQMLHQLEVSLVEKKKISPLLKINVSHSVNENNENGVNLNELSFCLYFYNLLFTALTKYGHPEHPFFSFLTRAF